MPRIKGFQVDIGLDDLNDASVLSSSARQVIRYNAGTWTNEFVDRIEDADNDTYIDIAGTQGGDADAITMAIGVSGLGAGVGSPFGAGSHTVFSASETNILIAGTTNNELGIPTAGGNIDINSGGGEGAGIDGGWINITGGTSQSAIGGQIAISAGAGQTFGGSVSMLAGNSIGLANAGGSATMYSGNGSVGGGIQVYAGAGSTGNGGQIDIKAGQANASAQTGGAINITGGLSSNTGYDGGGVAIIGGQANNSVGGAVTITGGQSNLGNGYYGGGVTINGANGDGGGSLNLNAGDANTNYSGSAGGYINLSAGFGSYGDGGSIDISSGNATYAAGGYAAGDLTVAAGTGQASNKGGDVFIRSGSSLSGGTAGDISIQPGYSSAADGIIKIVPNASATSAPELRFYEANPSTNYVGLKAPTLTADQTFTLPVSDGTAGQALVTSGAGAFSFDTVVKPDSNGLLPIELSKISTGLFSGGAVSLGTLSGSPATTTSFSVSAGSGIIVNNYTDPVNPTYQLVSWGAFTDVVVTNLATAQRTFIAIDITGSPNPTIIQQTTGFTHTQYRDYIILGTIGHANNVNVVAVRNNPTSAFDVTARLSDIAHALGAFNITGNVYFANGANLNLDKTVGESYRIGNNFHTNKASPDITTDIAETVLEFNYSYQDGTGGFTLSGKTSVIDPASWDDGDGGLGTVGNQSWSVQIIKFFPGGAGHRIEYGQKTYGTVDEALADVPDATHAYNPAFNEGIVRAYLVVRGGATNLSDTADARFIEAAKFTSTGGVTTAAFPGITDLSTGTVLTLTDTGSTFTGEVTALRLIAHGSGAVVTNTAIGNEALNVHTTGGWNTMVGYQAGAASDNDWDNVGVGYRALASNVSGYDNIAIGAQALESSVSASQNIGIGYQALLSSTTGVNNVAVGTLSLLSNLGGDSNTSIGTFAMSLNTSGYSNVAVGEGALEVNVSGYDNVACGGQAMNVNDTGFQNTAVGRNVFIDNLSGDNNTVIGYWTGRGITTGSGNTIVGARLYGFAAGLTDNIVIGNGNNTGAGSIKAQHDGTNWTLQGQVNTVLVTELQLASSPTTTYVADLATGSMFELTLGGDTAITFSNVPVTTKTATATFVLIQDATGNRVPTFGSGSPISIKWDGGTIPTWGTAAGDEDVVTMFTYDGGITWRANLVGQNYA